MSSRAILTIVNATGIICLLFALAMLLPAAVDLHYGNGDWKVFAMSAMIVAMLASFAVLSTQGRTEEFTLEIGFLMVVAMWFTASAVCAIPFVLASPSLSVADAVFESVSGLTTTGSTVISGLENHPPGFLLWRSITQWLGGIGIVAMGIVIIPFLKIGGMQFFRLESSDRTGKPVGRFREFATALIGVYALMSLLCMLTYKVLGMSWFDAVNHAMSTISTGGFSTRDASMAQESNAILLASSFYMLLGAMPFTLYIYWIYRQSSEAPEPQPAVLLSMIAAITAGMFAAAMMRNDLAPGDALVHALFNTVSLVTTTGYASADYLQWGPAIGGLILIATFIGGSAGSTAGGFKTYRLIILGQNLRLAIRELVYPHGVFPVMYRRRVVTPEAQKSVTVFFVAFIVVLIVSSSLLSATGLDFDTAFSGALTALCNVGPGWGSVIGPAGNFASLNDTAKWILTVTMLLGRLEIMVVLAVLSPLYWSRR